MNWTIIIPLVTLVIATIYLVITTFNQCNLSFQVVYVFLCEHRIWKKYRVLKKYSKDNIIPLININGYMENNTGFAFIQYGGMVFVIQEDNIYLSSYYNHLIKDLLKRNGHDS